MLALLSASVGFLVAALGATDLRAQRGRFLAIGLSLAVWITVFVAIAAGVIPYASVETTFYIWLGAVASVVIRLLHSTLLRQESRWNRK